MTYMIIFLIALITSIVVAIQNAEPVVFNALFWELEWPLALLLIVFFGVGMALGLLGVAPTLFRKSRHIKAERKKVANLEKEKIEIGKKLEEEHLKNNESNITEL